ncbi:MAG: hypothetical protein FWC72_00080 [Oscillospiraceae bacterium]|nr:hypothetical protein [Oscillospiraceae bacterium]
MDKIHLMEVNYENRVYYVDPKTGEFYTTYVKANTRALFVGVGIAIALGFVMTAFFEEIDSFYIPRSSTTSNALLLAAVVVAATIFHFWIKKRSKKKLAALKQTLQPVSLKDTRKREILEKTESLGIFCLIIMAVLLPTACILGYFFMRTSESRLFVLAGSFLIIFAGSVHWIKYMLAKISIARELLKQLSSRAQMKHK